MKNSSKSFAVMALLYGVQPEAKAAKLKVAAQSKLDMNL